MKGLVSVNKRITTIIATVISTILIILLVGSFVIGDYFYNIALNPKTNTWIAFNNDDSQTVNGQVSNPNDFFETHSYTNKYIQSDDGLKLHAYEFNQDSNVWVIIVHGYSSQGREMSGTSKIFYNMGYNVLTVDLRGHGLSEGEYIGMGWDDRLDVIKWAKSIIEKDPESKIILYGVSMGAVAVMNATGEELPNNIKLVIEDCGYSSTWNIFSHQLKSSLNLPSRPFLDFANIITKIRAGYSFDDGSAIEQVAKSKIPILFIHGSNDTFVPSYMMEDLYNAAMCPKDKLIIDGAGHGQSKKVSPKKYWDKITGFIKEYLK